MADEKILRTEPVRIKLEAGVLARLEHQAQTLGFPVASVCAFAVADWLRRQEQHEQLARLAVLDTVRRGMPDEAAMQRALEAALPAVMRALAESEGLDLDALPVPSVDAG